MLLITFILAYTMNVDMILSVRVSRPEMDEVFPAKYSCIILEFPPTNGKSNRVHFFLVQKDWPDGPEILTVILDNTRYNLDRL